MSQSVLNSPAKTSMNQVFNQKNAQSTLPHAQEVEPINENDQENLTDKDDYGALTLESKESKKQIKEMFKTPQKETTKLSFRQTHVNDSKNENKYKKIFD